MSTERSLEESNGRSPHTTRGCRMAMTNDQSPLIRDVESATCGEARSWSANGRGDDLQIKPWTSCIGNTLPSAEFGIMYSLWRTN